MGRWSEEDLLISVDLDKWILLQRRLRGPSNMRVDAETECDTKEWRFRFFASGDTAAGEKIIYNYGAFVISSGWVEFGL